MYCTLLYILCFCVFVYVIVYNYVNVCTSHNTKPFTNLLIMLTMIAFRFNLTKIARSSDYRLWCQFVHRLTKTYTVRCGGTLWMSCCEPEYTCEQVNSWMYDRVFSQPCVIEFYYCFFFLRNVVRKLSLNAFIKEAVTCKLEQHISRQCIIVVQVIY
mgnify:CR=1 FL=1